MKTKTTYQIINTGLSISPNLNRDEYYKEEWIKKEDVLELINEECGNFKHSCRLKKRITG